MVRAHAAIVLGISTLVATSVVEGAPDGSTVTGVIELADPASRPDPPVRSQGFTRRIRGPLKPPQKLDVRDQLVVVLTGGPVDDGDKKPPSAALRYEIIGESFAAPVFPFVAGAKIEIKNSGHREPLLYSPSQENLIEQTPIPGKGVRPIKGKLTEVFKAVDLAARDSAHLRGRLLPLPHAYFSLVDDRGRFEIKGVPAGTWTVKLWYRDGWVKIGKVTVDVSGKSSKVASIKLPPDVQTTPAAEAD